MIIEIVPAHVRYWIPQRFLAPRALPTAAANDGVGDFGNVNPERTKVVSIGRGTGGSFVHPLLDVLRVPCFSRHGWPLLGRCRPAPKCQVYERPKQQGFGSHGHSPLLFHKSTRIPPSDVTPRALIRRCGTTMRHNAPKSRRNRCESFRISEKRPTSCYAIRVPRLWRSRKPVHERRSPLA